MLSTEASVCRGSGPGRLASSPRVLPLRREQGGVELGPRRRESESAQGAEADPKYRKRSESGPAQAVVVPSAYSVDSCGYDVGGYQRLDGLGPARILVCTGMEK